MLETNCHRNFRKNVSRWELFNIGIICLEIYCSECQECKNSFIILTVSRILSGDIQEAKEKDPKDISLETCTQFTLKMSVILNNLTEIVGIL